CVITWLIAAGVLHGDTFNMISGLVFGSDLIQWGSSFFYAHSWSLSVEEQYYLLFPVLVFMLVGRGVRFTSLVLAAIYVAIVFAPNVGKIAKPHLFGLA